MRYRQQGYKRKPPRHLHSTHTTSDNFRANPVSELWRISLTEPDFGALAKSTYSRTTNIYVPDGEIKPRSETQQPDTPSIASQPHLHFHRTNTNCLFEMDATCFTLPRTGAPERIWAHPSRCESAGFGKLVASYCTSILVHLCHRTEFPGQPWTREFCF